MKKAIVTGTHGFIGKQIANKLADMNFQVLGIDDEYFEKTDWQSGLKTILEEFSASAIFHAGACSNTLETNVNSMMVRNYESTKLLTNWCGETSTPFIYSSSAANYGINGIYPENLYGWSKYTSEDYVVSNHGVALRYFNVYGPGEQNKGVMASFIYQAFFKNLSGTDIFLFPNNPRRDFIYIEDVVEANIYAYLNYEKLKSRVYEVSTGVANSFEIMLDAFGLKYGYLEASSIPQGYQFYTCGDSNKWMPGWIPKFSLESGLKAYKDYLHDDK